MAALGWDLPGEHFFETGVKHAVVYPYSTANGYKPGVAWNGITSISESPSGAEETKLFADDTKYLSLLSLEEFGATIEAYTYPDAFALLDGSKALGEGVMVGQQERGMFGLSYVTQIGNDVKGTDYEGEKIHLIYGAKVTPSEKAYSTINDSPEAITFSWTMTTTPVEVGTGFKPTASIVLDTRTVPEAKLAKIKALLYGTDPDEQAGTEGTDPELPLPSKIKEILEENDAE